MLFLVGNLDLSIMGGDHPLLGGLSSGHGGIFAGNGSCWVYGRGLNSEDKKGSFSGSRFEMLSIF